MSNPWITFSPERFLRRLRQLAVVAAGALVIATVVGYLWIPTWLTGARVQMERVVAGLHWHETLTPGGLVPYLAGGEGQTLVLVHGFLQDKDSWLPFAQHLTDRYEVVIPDLQGFGDNAGEANGDFSLDSQVRRLHRFLTTRRLEQVHLVGWGMGADIAGLYAAQHPERVRSLGLFGADGAPVDDSDEIAQRLHVDPTLYHLNDRTAVDSLLRLFGDGAGAIPRLERRALARRYDQRGALWDRVFRQISSPSARAELDSVAPRIPVRTLLLHGAHDRAVSLAGVERLARRFPSATLVVLPDCAHLCPVTQAEEAAEHYRQFLMQ